ncbi:MAG TPA: rhodanese-like domain-containing protein [bacterium]|nr:rhodanese-like domain-containing protein [bacterium]
MSMTKEDVREKMKEKDVVLLNVGAEENYLKLHIQGSLNQPLTFDRGFFAQEVERKFGRNKFFITYGPETAGIENMNGSQILHEKGFQTEHFPGGLAEWEKAGWPTEGSASKPKPASIGVSK